MMSELKADSRPALPPGIPPDADPDTYRVESVTELLHRSAFFPIFSIPSTERRTSPIFMPGGNKIIGMEVFEDLHRFDVRVEAPEGSRGFRVRNAVGQPAATVHIHWMVAPDDFSPAPGRWPPPTPLDVSRQQRFVMLDGEFLFLDSSRSGFHGFGHGRTFPTMFDGKPQLRIGANVEMLEGLGKLRGHTGNVSVNGYLTPPHGLALGLMARVIDLPGQVSTTAALTDLKKIDSPDPNAVFLTLMGERDPQNPITLATAPDGSVIGANVTERLRLVHFSFDTNTSRGLRSRTRLGQIVGSLRFLLQFNLLDPRVPFPFSTSKGEFRFFDLDGTPAGTMEADIVEGQSYKTELRGAPTPIFRMVGFGPVIRGTGQFSGASGMLSVNGAISVFPRSPALLYFLRLQDPYGKFRQCWS